MAGVEIDTVHLALSGPHIKGFNSRGVIAVAGKNREVTRDDVGRAIEAAKAVSLPTGREILHVLPQDFVVDDQTTNGVDVSGKIVAVLANAPPRLASEPRAHYASAELKQHNAAERGAVALVTLLGPDDEKRFPWSRMKAFHGRPTMAWTDDGGTPGAVDKRLRATAYLNEEGAARLFQRCHGG